MRLRMPLILSLLLLGLNCLPGFSQAASATAQPPEAVIQEFYKWYLRALNQNGEPLTKGRATLKKYVTLRFIREIDRALKGPDGLDADVFLEAQDFDKDWGKNIKVANVVTRYSTTTALVTLNGKDIPNHKLSLTLKQEGGAWKIDKVKNLDN